MLITHDMGVIAETADRVAVMYAGRIVEIGPVREVVQRPHHPYTVGLMGAIPTVDDARRNAWCRFRAPCRGSPPSRRAAPSIPAARMPSTAAAVERPERMPAGASEAACWLIAETGRGRRMTAAPLVEVRDLARVFDVSKPWLNRVIEGEKRTYLKAVNGVSFTIGRRETLGAGGQVGLRQVDGGAHDRGAAASPRPAASPSTASTCGRRRAGASASGCAGACR